MQSMKEEILDLLILGNYSFEEVASDWGMSVEEVRAIYRKEMSE
jgi:hypothetical protein